MSPLPLEPLVTGWEPPKEKPKQIAFPGFDDERDAAGKVEQEKPILVILGNPPYNAFAGVSPEEENGLVEPYKKGLISEWGIKKFNLDELYSRFLRLAERRVAEKGGRGVVCYISSFSYISDPSFVVLRKRFLDEFDSFWIDCLNGDSRETGKQTPDGGPDPSVFSTEWNKAGIQLGAAVGLFVKRGQTCGEREGITVADKNVRFRHFWGRSKREDLLASLNIQDFDAQYEISNPRKDNRWSFRPSDIATAYLAWPKVTEICALLPYNGPIERRGNSLIVFPDERGRLMRVADYLDPTVSDDDIRDRVPEFMNSSGEFKADKTRSQLKGRRFDASRIVTYPFKPFDIRIAYLDPDIAPLFSRPAPQLLNHRFSGNCFFITRDTADKDPEGPPFFFSPVVCDYDCISGHARHFPIRFKMVPARRTSDRTLGALALPGMETESEKITANLSPAARAYLAEFGLPDPDADQATAELIWYHALAIGYSPAYLAENADGIRQDWPRIPLPQAKDSLLVSASLGRQVAALLDTETPVPGVSVGKIRDDLKGITVFQRVDGKPANPEEGDLDLTAGWGHAGKGGVTMPGRGKLIRRDDGACEYRPRRPQDSDYYRCVEDYFETFVQIYDEHFSRQYGFWRPYVQQVIYRYLDCGDIHNGFARVKCKDCGHTLKGTREYLLAFSCKRRHFCPSCHACPLGYPGRASSGTEKAACALQGRSHLPAQGIQDASRQREDHQGIDCHALVMASFRVPRFLRQPHIAQ